MSELLPLRVLVVDDERSARKFLRTTLAAHPWISLVGEAACVEEAALLAAGQRPDVVLLDVQIPPASGFDLLPRLPTPAPAVIFVTAHDAYAVRAFEVSAVDYLLKPFSEERLLRALQRVQHGRNPSSAKNCGSRSISSLTLDGAVVLRDASRIRRVEVRDIAAVVAEGSYTQVHFASDRPMLVLRTMADWEALLPAPPFLRVDRSLVVNLERIVGIDVHSRDKGELTLQANGSPRLHLGRLALNRVREALAT